MNQTLTNVTQKLNKDIIIPFKKVINKKDGTVIVKCLNKEDVT